MTDSPSDDADRASEEFAVQSSYLSDTASEQNGGPVNPVEASEVNKSTPQTCPICDNDNDLVDWLQMLLEAEHAGALIMVDSLKETRSESLTQRLEALHISEAVSCQRLRLSLKRLGAVPSKRVSDFYAKAMAIVDIDERLEFISRGQRWVARRLEEKLPTITQSWLRQELNAVLKLHT